MAPARRGFGRPWRVGRDKSGAADSRSPVGPFSELAVSRTDSSHLGGARLAGVCAPGSSTGSRRTFGFVRGDFFSGPSKKGRVS